MTEQPLRPIWTPDDALQAARDAANEPAVLVERATLRPASTSPPRGRGCAPGPVALRPRRAAQRAKAMLCVAVILMMLTAGVLWADLWLALPR